MNTSEFSGKLLNIKYDFKYKGGYCDDCIYLGQTENGEMSGLGEVVFYNSEDKKISLSTGKWVENCKLGEFKEYYKNGTLAFTGSYSRLILNGQILERALTELFFIKTQKKTGSSYKKFLVK